MRLHSPSSHYRHRYRLQRVYDIGRQIPIQAIPTLGRKETADLLASVGRVLPAAMDVE